MIYLIFLLVSWQFGKYFNLSIKFFNLSSRKNISSEHLKWVQFLKDIISDFLFEVFPGKFQQKQQKMIKKKGKLFCFKVPKVY